MLSVAMFAIAAALCGAFVFEAGGNRIAALTGGVAVAFSPYTAFIASGVTPDALLLLISVALTLTVLRALNTPATIRGMSVLGTFIGAGLVTKITFVAFVPAIGLACIIVIARLFRRSSDLRFTARALLALLVTAVALPLLMLLWLEITGRNLIPTGPVTASISPSSVRPSSTREALSYAWQDFLPRLPFMSDQFGFNSINATWLRGFAGRYGWLDYAAPPWVGTIFVRFHALLGAALLVIVATNLKSIARRRVAITVGAVAVLGLVALLAKAGYDYRRTTGFVFEQPRYLFPIAALYALALGVVVTRLLPRAAPWFAVCLVALAFAHNISGLAVTFQRYYS